MKRLSFIIAFVLLVSIANFSFAKEVSFTQDDRDRLIRLETKLEAFEKSVDKRLEFMQNLMIGMLAVFGGLCGVFVGLLLWDRKTFKEKAKEEAMRELEKKWRIGDWIEAFKEYAKSNKELAEILKKCHLL